MRMHTNGNGSEVPNIQHVALDKSNRPSKRGPTDAQVISYYKKHGCQKTQKHFGFKGPGKLYPLLHANGIKLNTRKRQAKARTAAQSKTGRGVPGGAGSRHSAGRKPVLSDALTYLAHARTRLEASVLAGDRSAGPTLGLVCLALEALGSAD